MYYQINNYMENRSSKNLCFRKGFSAQHCLIVMLEKLRTSLDKKKNFGVLLTDLSKAFACLNHELLRAKLNSYGFDHNSIKLIQSYLSNRFQRVRINSKYSKWRKIINGVPQLSNLFLFTENSEIANYVDDNSP